MTTLQAESGEAIEAMRRRRVRALAIVYITLAALVVLGTLLFKRAGPHVEPGGALLITALFVGAMGLSVWERRHTDEVEARISRNAAAWGMGFYLVTYPSWFILWAGGFLPEPDHVLMFGATIAVAAVAYCLGKRA